MTNVTENSVQKTLVAPVPNGNGYMADVPPQRATDRLGSSPPSDPVSLAVMRPGIDAQALLQGSELPTAYPEVPSGFRVELGLPFETAQ